MIPQTQLQKLKPIQDIKNRRKLIKGRQSISKKKGRLTKRARQWARYPEMKIKGNGPKGIRWIGKRKDD